jgi:hypothetical protein
MINIVAECQQLFEGYITFDKNENSFCYYDDAPNDVIQKFYEWLTKLPNSKAYTLIEMPPRVY